MKKLSILIVAAVVLSACSGKNQSTDLEKLETDRFSVRAETIDRRHISEELLLNGSVKAWEEAIIYPRVDGKLLENVLREGDNVKRNQTLALIERDEVGAVYESVVVPSTINGVIGKTYLDPGANVTKSTAIALVVNQDDVRIIVEIPERYIGKIHMGQKATFTLEAYGERLFEAEVYKISPVVDVQSRVVTAELKAHNKDKAIKSGMFTKVKLILDDKQNALSAGINSVLKDEEDGNSYVFVINGDTVAKTQVNTGLKSTSYYEIVSGIDEGTEIIKIVFGVKDGSKIKVENK